MSKKILSGVQASGNLHLGNYLGAIRNWVKLQEQNKCTFFIADLHAITVPIKPEDLNNSIYNTVATYIACGIDPNKSCIFIQSSIQAHAELAWLLTCHTPMGWLKRMTQFKDKAGKGQDKASTGLFTYPILMAADILLYDADYVPVGEDQKQHIELARDIAGAVNRHIGEDLLKLPEPMIAKTATRIMSLKDGNKKMSKSDPSDNSRINLTDDKDIISSKIKKAKTDSFEYISYDKENRPEISNLLEIFANLSDHKLADIEDNYKNKGMANFKNDLADLVIGHISPIKDKYDQLISDKKYLEGILKNGKEAASQTANQTNKIIMQKLGYPTI